MVVDTQPDAATACAVLPDSFGPGPLPAVIRIPGNYTITLRYRTDDQALLPGRTVAEPVVSFRCRRAEGIDWADGTSHFAGAAATVDVACADGTTLRGMHFLIGWEDDAMAVILGREVVGTVKLPASVTFDRGLRGADRCLVHHRGHPLMEMTRRKAGELTAGELAGLRAAARDGRTIGYKGLPLADGRTLGEQYATAIPTAAEVHFRMARGRRGDAGRHAGAARHAAKRSRGLGVRGMAGLPAVFALRADREPHWSASDLAAARPLRDRPANRDDVHGRTRPRGHAAAAGWPAGGSMPLAGACRRRGRPGRGGLMALRERRRTLLLILLGAAAIAVHLALGTWAVLAASRWAGPAAIGLAVAVVLALHLVGLRRLRARRASAHQDSDIPQDAG